MSDSDDTQDHEEIKTKEVNSPTSSPSILVGVSSKAKPTTPTSSKAQSKDKSPIKRALGALIPCDRPASPEYLLATKIQKIEKEFEESWQSTQDIASQNTQWLQSEKDEICEADQRVSNIERQADILESLKTKGVQVRTSKEFKEVKENLIQARLLLTSLNTSQQKQRQKLESLSQYSDTVEASKQDLFSLASKQKRLLNVFKRYKDLVSKIQSLKRADTEVANNQVLPALQAVTQQSKHLSSSKPKYGQQGGTESSCYETNHEQNLAQNQRHVAAADNEKRKEISINSESLKTAPDPTNARITESTNNDMTEDLSQSLLKVSTASPLVGVVTGTASIATSTLQEGSLPIAPFKATSQPGAIRRTVYQPMTTAISTQTGQTGAVARTTSIASSHRNSVVRIVPLQMTAPIGVSQACGVVSLPVSAFSAITQVGAVGMAASLPMTPSTLNSQPCVIVRLRTGPLSVTGLPATQAGAVASTDSTPSSKVYTVAKMVSATISQACVMAGRASLPMTASSASTQVGVASTTASLPMTNFTTSLQAGAVATTASLSLTPFKAIPQAHVAANAASTATTVSRTASLPVATSTLISQAGAVARTPFNAVPHVYVAAARAAPTGTTVSRTASQSVAASIPISQADAVARTPFNAVPHVYVAAARAASTGTTVSRTASLPVAASTPISQADAVAKMCVTTATNSGQQTHRRVPMVSIATGNKSDSPAKENQHRGLAQLKKPEQPALSSTPAADLTTLLQHKVISPGLAVLSVQTQGRKFEASLKPNGHIESTGGEVFHTPMAWLKAVTGSKTVVRQPVAYSKICYKNKPLSSFSLPDSTSMQRNDGTQQTKKDSIVTNEVQNKNISSTCDLSAKLLQANCKIHLISDNELIPTATILPVDFWDKNFDEMELDPKLLEF